MQSRAQQWQHLLFQFCHDPLQLAQLMRSRLHRMILSVYIGLGLTIIFGFIHTNLVRKGAGTSGILSFTYLLASILTVTFSILALRIVVAIPLPYVQTGSSVLHRYRTHGVTIALCESLFSSSVSCPSSPCSPPLCSPTTILQPLS